MPADRRKILDSGSFRADLLPALTARVQCHSDRPPVFHILWFRARAEALSKSPAGSPTNTTTIFDGEYTQGVVQNASASAGKSLSECPKERLNKGLAHGEME